MSSEAALYDALQAKLVYFGRLDRVENRLGSGTGMPDLAYLLRRNPRAPSFSGWLELKYEPRWPTNAQTPVVLSILTLEQVLWQEDYHRLGGRVFTLAQIGTGYVLMDAPTVRQVYSRALNRRTLLARALCWSQRALPATEVLKCLTT